MANKAGLEIPSEASELQINEAIEHSITWLRDEFQITPSAIKLRDAECWVLAGEPIDVIVINPDFGFTSSDVQQALEWYNGSLDRVIWLSLRPMDAFDETVDDALENRGIALYMCIQGYGGQRWGADAFTFRARDVAQLGSPPAGGDEKLAEWIVSLLQTLKEKTPESGIMDDDEEDEQERIHPLKESVIFRTWSAEDNVALPEDVDLLADAEMEAVWICKKGHRWQASIGRRVLRQEAFACPVCYPHDQTPTPMYRFSLESQYPELGATWDSLRELSRSSSTPMAKDIHYQDQSRSLILQCVVPGHYVGVLRVPDFISGFGADGRTCWACRQTLPYKDVLPGEIMATWASPTSRTERLLSTYLEEWFALAGGTMNAIKFAQAFFDYPWGKPDILIPDLRIAVEFDGTGALGVEEGHETPKGEARDRLKDELLREVGWEVVRVRTAGMKKLGPYDVQAESIGSKTVREIAWMVLIAAENLGTLQYGLHSLTDKSLTLLSEGI